MKRATHVSVMAGCSSLATAVAFVSFACTAYSYSAPLDAVQLIPTSYSFICPDPVLSVEATAQHQHILVDLHALLANIINKYHRKPVATLMAVTTALSLSGIIYMLKDRIASGWNNLTIKPPVAIATLDGRLPETATSINTRDEQSRQ